MALAGGELALSMGTGHDFSGPGFKISGIEVRNGRGQIWNRMSLVRPILMPALLAEKSRRFIADLPIVKIQVRPQKIDHNRDNTRLGELIEPIVIRQRLIHHTCDIFGIKRIGLVSLGHLHKTVAHILRAPLCASDQIVETTTHLLHFSGTVKALQKKETIVIKRTLLLWCQNQ